MTMIDQGRLGNRSPLFFFKEVKSMFRVINTETDGDLIAEHH